MGYGDDKRASREHQVDLLSQKSFQVGLGLGGKFKA